MTTDNIRPFGSLSVDGAVELWNHVLPADPIAVTRFLAKIVADPHFDPNGFLVAWNGTGDPVGFVWAVAPGTAGPDEDTAGAGYLVSFGVAPDARGQGFGTRLIEAAHDYLRARGCRQSLVSPYAPGYLWPGVDPDRYPAAGRLLERLGYERSGDCVAMHRLLTTYSVPPAIRERERRLAEAGYGVAQLTPDGVVPLIELVRREFGPDWTRSVREAVARGLLDHILVARRDSAVVGFAMFGAYDGVPDRFGPFGVAEVVRGLGLGAVLLHRTLEEMAGRGLHAAWFQWTDLESPAGHLYRRADFSVTRRFELWRRTLI